MFRVNGNSGMILQTFRKKRDNFCNKEASTFQKLIEIIYLFTYRNLNEYNEKYFLLLITFKTKKNLILIQLNYIKAK